jgi:carboxyaminopropylagmatine decarboxylase
MMKAVANKTMMNCDTFAGFDAQRAPSPCYVVDEVAIERNLKILARVQNESGAKVLLALKAFSMFSLAPLVSKYLSGTCASGLYEAKLGAEEFGGEVHTFSAAFTAADLPEIFKLSDHVVFNSFSQWHRFEGLRHEAVLSKPSLKFGLRINPQHSEGAADIYNPCAAGSRLGITLQEFEAEGLASDGAANKVLDGISGLHFHTLCEQGFDALDRTLDAVEQQFGELLHKLEWLNFGGGHHITKPGYDVDGLIARVRAVQEKYNLQVYLEPGEAIAIHSGVLVSEVLDLKHNALPLAILDTSATCHMPDTLEMPYRAEIFGAEEADVNPHTYRLGGQTCLAGDVMGDYSFEQPLSIGQRLMFDDMAHYTMVKTSTFNGIGLPAIAVWNSESDALRVVKEFSYEDFKTRLS